MKSMPICKAETPMVFCFRLGSLSGSKSQLINTLINDRHNTFFHRNCPGSTKSRLLFDGVVEIAWYCPAGRSSDTFTDCVAFCNLHGDATCGLEHIFREMGQIYEAHVSLKKQPKDEATDWSKYPELAAELMISGHPMELMDGDAGQVPITWISGLIDQVISKLGEKKFAVSAGRCTRGAFMQLVKLSEEMSKDFQWDYILVVDTEGLRALELEGNTTLHHDNELATFVVGIGNMTLVNIFGENPSEMQDVLQIVNVTDVGAAEKTWMEKENCRRNWTRWYNWLQKKKFVMLKFQ
ncbi:hypothetical protein WMY93_027664 [Mugilogobius chulae]|uniref:VLIG-type G domain-containing protein n=1 Tax=Mugilogobius chulae TaxID=88201 RepID=A0AAW0MUQ0_9GOBI